MSDVTILKVFVSLGVPGLVVGIIYFLIKYWKVNVPPASKKWGGPIIVLIIGVIGWLTYQVIDRVFPTSKPGAVVGKAARQSQFDAQFEGATFFKLPEDILRGEFRLKLVPLTKDNAQVSTVFLGLAAIHDDDKYTEEKKAGAKSQGCNKMPSCLTTKIWRYDTPEEGFFIRGDAASIPLTWTMDFPSKVHRIRLNWVFYQREGENGSRCEVDMTKEHPDNTLPYVHAVKDGKEAFNWCYNALGRKTILVKLEGG